MSVPRGFGAVGDPWRLANEQERVVGALYDTLGPDDPRVAAELSRMGALVRAAGDLGAAAAVGARAHATLVSLVGEEHPLALSSATELGLTALASGDLAEGERLLHSVYDVTAAAPWAEPAELGLAAANLALALRASGDINGALKLMDDAVTRLRDAYGGLDVHTIAAETNLAALLGAAGHTRGAIALLSEVRDRCVQELGANHPVTLGVEANLGVAFRQAGKITAARDALQRVHAELADVAGAEHPSTLGVASDLALTLGESMDPSDGERAIELGRHVVRERTARLGDRHPQTLHAMRYLARTASGHDDELAWSVGGRAARASEKTLGPAHPDTVHAYTELADMLERGDRLDAAYGVRERTAATAAGDAPPLENLAGAVAGADVFTEGDFAHVVAADGVSRTDVIARTAHVKLDPARGVRPGDSFAALVQLGPAEEEAGPGTGRVEIAAPSGLDRFALDVWLIPTPHFELLDSAIQSLVVERAAERSKQLRFSLRALTEKIEGDPALRVRFSYNGWPSGDVELPVPLLAPEPVTA